MTATMPPDFFAYMLLAYAAIATAVVGAITVVVGAFFGVRVLVRRWRARRVRDVHAERKRWQAEQGRRDGYVNEDLDVAAIRALLAHRDAVGDPEVRITRPDGGA